jgi:hypothetical protein
MRDFVYIHMAFHGMYTGSRRRQHTVAGPWPWPAELQLTADSLVDCIILYPCSIQSQARVCFQPIETALLATDCVTINLGRGWHAARLGNDWQARELLDVSFYILSILR